MASDSFLAVAFTSAIAMFLGFVVAFGGYRFFLVLLPIWGFFWGFGFGAHSMQALFGEAFLATILSWMVGFVFGAIFAVLSYFFYFFGVALLAGSLGYSLGVSLMLAFGMDFGFLPWLVGIVVGGIFVLGALLLNIQKWIVIIASAILGAGIIVGTFLFLFSGQPANTMIQNPVRHVLQTSPFWLAVFIVIAVFGVIVQYATTRTWEVETYDRLAEMSSTAEST